MRDVPLANSACVSLPFAPFSTTAVRLDFSARAEREATTEVSPRKESQLGRLTAASSLGTAPACNKEYIVLTRCRRGRRSGTDTAVCPLRARHQERQTGRSQITRILPSQARKGKQSGLARPRQRRLFSTQPYRAVSSRSDRRGRCHQQSSVYALRALLMQAPVRSLH